MIPYLLILLITQSDLRYTVNIEPYYLYFGQPIQETLLGYYIQKPPILLTVTEENVVELARKSGEELATKLGQNRYVDLQADLKALKQILEFFYYQAVGVTSDYLVLNEGFDLFQTITEQDQTKRTLSAKNLFDVGTTHVNNDMYQIKNTILTKFEECVLKPFISALVQGSAIGAEAIRDLFRGWCYETLFKRYQCEVCDYGVKFADRLSDLFIERIKFHYQSFCKSDHTSSH